MLVMARRVMNPFIRDDLPSALISGVLACGKPQSSASLRSCSVLPMEGMLLLSFLLPPVSGGLSCSTKGTNNKLVSGPT